jgi:hypothetical protein
VFGITPFAGSSFAELGSVSATIAITGVVTTASVGSVTASVSVDIAITSQAATGQVGSTTEITTAITGITADPATGLVGNVVATGDIVASTKKGGDDAPRTIKKLKYKPRLRKDDFGNEIIEAIPVDLLETAEPDEEIAVEGYKYDLDADKYELKQTQDMLNELQSHLDYQLAAEEARRLELEQREIDDEEAILMLL